MFQKSLTKVIVSAKAGLNGCTFRKVSVWRDLFVAGVAAQFRPLGLSVLLAEPLDEVKRRLLPLWADVGDDAQALTAQRGAALAVGAGRVREEAGLVGVLAWSWVDRAGKKAK